MGIKGVKGNRLCGIAAAAAMLASPLLSAATAPSLDDAIAGGKVKLDLRLRYEGVQQDNAAKDADAVTLRTALGYTTAAWNDLTGFAEVQNNSALLDAYAPATAGYSTVADPEVTDVSQWGLSYTGVAGLKVTGGRSRLILDNARWVGNVGWRQNEQTYDGAFVTFSGLPGVTAQYDYLAKVHSILDTTADLEGHLFNLKWAALPALSVSAYAYLLDFDIGTDFDTYGLRASGSTPLSESVKLSYAAEYASQNADTGAVDFDTDYYLGQLGVAFKTVSVQIGYEVLGSDGGNFALQTPLATKHAYQGWADVFLATPPEGVKDLSATIKGKVGPVVLMAVYHDFTADDSNAAKASYGGDRYGSEFDALAKMKLVGRLSGLVKYASYSADDFGVDTDKVWVQLQYGL